MNLRPADRTKISC